MSSLVVLEALGTRWWITSPEAIPEQEIRAEISTFQNKYSRFDVHSDLSYLNTEKYFDSPSDEFTALLQYGVRAFKETAGLFNMSVGGYLEQQGYGKDTDPAAQLSRNLEQDIRILANGIEIASHIRLDFGGFGKGWLIDKIGALLRRSGVDSFIINGGGDILVGDRVEQLFIEHPLISDQQIGYLLVGGSAFASSSAQKRTWKSLDGVAHSHIVQTGIKPSVELASVHVRAKTALTADTFGTVFLIANASQWRLFSEENNLEYMAIFHDLYSIESSQFEFVRNK